MINCCVSGVPPTLVYKGVEEGPAKEGGAPKGGSPTPTGSRTPPFPIWSRRGKEEEGGRKERGGVPFPIRIGLGGALSCSFPLLSTKAQ